MSTTETIDPRIEERAAALSAAQREQERERFRVVAEAEIAAETAEAERQREFAEFTAALPERLSTAAIEKAQRQMEKAIDAYVATCRQRGAVLSEAYDFISRNGGGHVTPGSGTVLVGETTYLQHNVQRGIYDAAAAALREHYPRTEVRLT